MAKKEYLLSLSDAKDIMNSMDRTELVDLFLESYKAVPELKEFISVKYSSEERMDEIFSFYVEKVYNEFLYARKRKVNLTAAKKIVTDFKKICPKDSLVISLMLHYVEAGIEYDKIIGDSHYDNIIAMYTTVVDTLNRLDDLKLYNLFAMRLKNVVDRAKQVRWYGQDSLQHRYHEINWPELRDIKG